MARRISWQKRNTDGPIRSVRDLADRLLRFFTFGRERTLGNLPLQAILFAIALCLGLLLLFMVFARSLVRRFGFSLEDEAAVVFCGSKKSLASGLPMAKVLFSGHPGFGMIVLPIMCYNQIQVIVGAFLAQKYRDKIERANAEKTG